MSADVIVVGSGAAGIAAALAAAGRGLNVLLITKDQNGGATPLAQGGLAAALGPGDDPDQHVSDTMAAGAGLCNPSVVSALALAAPAAISWLAGLGARLDRVALRREGGHRRHRIVHSGNDATGAEVHRVLLAALRASRVQVLDRATALDLVPGGLLVAGPDGVQTLMARAVVLAAGGLGQAYATTTNPPGATGDAIALALRAGVVLRDPEFVQFHPTVLHLPAGSVGQRPLITEALRGAGATLLTHSGGPLMASRHPFGDLAPRDVVSAVMAERLADGDPHLWLDATGLGASVLETGFPTVTAACRSHGIDPVTDPIPVAPGAHYYCGGIRAGLDGRTSLPGLYAVGEAASTGVHGANRLASNSVTEALIAGARTGETLEPSGSETWPLRATAGSAGLADRAAVAAAMSRHAGVLRDADGLRALLRFLGDSVPARVALEDTEAANLRTVSALIATAALAREESRGCHRRRDAPATEREPLHTLVRWDGSQLTITHVPVGAHTLVAS
ncbi:MAG: L-aspartate oxidase [Streptosporangiaceae bacterium]|jgi:L-aspartate oxidase